MSVLGTLSALAALVISAGALVAGVLALAVTRRPALALGVFLDLLLAAGLLRLAGDPSWESVATAAAIADLRHLIGLGLRIGGRAWATALRPVGTAAAGEDVRRGPTGR